MKLSFVILNYNRANELLETISRTRQLMDGKEDYELIVVDNASTDQSVSTVKQSYPEVRLVERKVNNGIAGWNDGFAIAKGDYFVVLDDDSNIERGLEEAVAILDDNHGEGESALKVIGGGLSTDNMVHL